MKKKKINVICQVNWGNRGHVGIKTGIFMDDSVAKWYELNDAIQMIGFGLKHNDLSIRIIPRLKT